MIAQTNLGESDTKWAFCFFDTSDSDSNVGFVYSGDSDSSGKRAENGTKWGLLRGICPHPSSLLTTIHPHCPPNTQHIIPTEMHSMHRKGRSIFCRQCVNLLPGLGAVGCHGEGGEGGSGGGGGGDY